MAKSKVIKRKKNLLDIQKELVKTGELVNCTVTETVSENILGKDLSDNGVKLIPQYNVGNYSFDFKVKHYPILIEVDGSIHNTSRKRRKDSIKDRYAMLQGFKVIRVGNIEVCSKDRPRIVSEIKQIIANCIKQPREIQLYPMTIWENLKFWFSKKFRLNIRTIVHKVYGEVK